jgi:iron complex transport system substrate-binding protein
VIVRNIRLPRATFAVAIGAIQGLSGGERDGDTRGDGLGRNGEGEPRAGGGQGHGSLWRGIGLARGGEQRVEIAQRGQRLREVLHDVGQRGGMQIDAERQIESVRDRAATSSGGGDVIAAGQHRFLRHARFLRSCSVPVFASFHQSLLLVAAMLLLAAAPAAAQAVKQGAAQSAAQTRVVSLNMCTDQLLLDLAQPAQIAGLSPFAADVARSFLADRARALPILSGTAEEVMVLKPDLVVSGTFTKRATREFIRARGVPLQEFAPVRSLAESRRQIKRFGEITGASDIAASRIAELDAGLAELRAAAAAHKLSVLPLARRAWVSGSQSLISELLSEAGLVNAAGALGIRTGGRVTLEQIVMLKPDAILISRDDDLAEDQGRAMLLHPAIQSLFPPERRIIIPERLTICGGPMLADAMRALAGQISRLQPRGQ